MFYRSSSLYHPQRRAILHLKNQTRKIKCKKEEKKLREEESPPIIDLTCFKSYTFRLLTLSSSLSFTGLVTPVLYLPVSLEARIPAASSSVASLYSCLGLSWVLGCLVFGLVVTRNSRDCFISRQYLCQSSLLLCGLTLGLGTQVEDQSSYVVFGKYMKQKSVLIPLILVCTYGFLLGGYQYSLKMFVFEKVRSKRFPWAWSLLQCCQAPLLLVGMPVNGFVDWYFGQKSSLVLSVILILIGSFIMVLIDVLKRRYKVRRRSRHRATLESEAPMNEGEIEPMGKDDDDIEEVNDDVAGEYERRNSLPDGDDDFLPPLTLMTQQRSVTYGDLVDGNNQRVSYISEVSQFGL